MGCGGSKHTEELERLQRQQAANFKQLQEEQALNRKLIQAQNEQLAATVEGNRLITEQFQDSKVLQAQQQKQLEVMQNQSIQMALEVRQQAEMTANTAAERALRKAEEIKKLLTPPPKPGKVNVLVQTEKTYGPHAVLKRRKPKDPSLANQDHREACGGVGTDTVAAPEFAQVPVMVVREKDRAGSVKTGDSEEKDEDYVYEYEYQYQYQYADDLPSGPAPGPKAMIAPGANIPGAMPLPAVPGQRSPPRSPAQSRKASAAKRGSSRASSRHSSQQRQMRQQQPVAQQPPPQQQQEQQQEYGDEEYEYEYEDEED